MDASSDVTPTLLSLAEAAQAVGTTVQSLWLRVQRGELQIHRVLEHGRTSTAVALKDILELYMGHGQQPSVPPMPATPPPGFAPPAYGAPHPDPPVYTPHAASTHVHPAHASTAGSCRDHRR